MRLTSVRQCLTAFCAQNAFINANSDVIVGLVGWAAGSFSTSYLLSLTPSKAAGGGFIDNTLAKQCVLDTWLNANETIVIPTTGASTTASSSSVPGQTSISGVAPTGGNGLTPAITPLPTQSVGRSASSVEVRSVWEGLGLALVIVWTALCSLG